MNFLDPIPRGSSLEAQPERLAGRVDLDRLAVGCALWSLDLRFDAFGWRERFPGVAA